VTHTRRWTLGLGVVAVAAALGVTAWRVPRPPAAAAEDGATFVRRLLWQELQPATLADCTLERFGEPGDGGYLLCANLLKDVRAGYSYGISGYDGWGCDVATRRQVPVHQYDCFNTTVPACAAPTTFHAECVADTAHVADGRPFATIADQLTKNGDLAGQLVVKMDVEGAEWAALATAPHDVLARIDQLVVEFHGTDQRSYVNAVRRLKQYFHVANLHMNNHSCAPAEAPFPAWAYEVLFVNRRLVDAVSAAPPRPPYHLLDRPNAADQPDCQPVP